MNKEEIWFTTRHVAGSGGVAAQASGFQRMPGRELRRIAKRAPRRRLRALRVRLRRIFPPFHFGAFPLRLMPYAAQPLDERAQAH